MTSERLGTPNKSLFFNANLLCVYGEFWKRQELQKCKSSKRDREEIFHQRAEPKPYTWTNTGIASPGKISFTVSVSAYFIALDL